MGSFRGLVRGLPRFDKNAAAGGGGPVYTWATFDPTWGSGSGAAGGWILSNGNLTVSCTDGSNGGNGPGTIARHTTGKYYWEIHTDNPAPGGFDAVIGIGSRIHSGNFTVDYGNPGHFGNIADGTWVQDGVSTTHPSGGVVFAPAGFITGFAVDLDTRKIFVRNAAGYVGGGDPVAETNPICTLSTITGNGTGGITPFAVVSSGSPNAKFTANFGQSAFVYPVPAGYIPGWPTT